MKILLVSGASLIPLMWSVPAAAVQSRCAQFELIGDGARIRYNPFDVVDAQENFFVRVQGLADNVRRVRFLLIDTTPTANGPKLGAYGPDYYEIRWLDDVTRHVLISDNQAVTSTNAAEARLGRDGVDIVRFRLVVPRGQAAPARLHTENIVVRYQCLSANGTAIGSQEEQSAPLEVQAEVPIYAAAYVGSMGLTRGTIAFGEIGPTSSNLTGRISITALSTVPYEVAFRSDNAGMLRRTRNDTRGIGYTMRYAGTAVTSGERLLCPTTPAPSGKSDDFEVALNRDEIRSLPAGDYSDVVTITFTPQDVANPGGCAASSASSQ